VLKVLDVNLAEKMIRWKKDIVNIMMTTEESLQTHIAWLVWREIALY
jgi:hypothetical protein